MKKPKHIVVHCTDSLWGNAARIDEWHKEKGWSRIGYHYVILNGQLTKFMFNPSLDGYVEVGRPLDDDEFLEPHEFGAHSLGYNQTSIGIVLVGIQKFTVAQFESLADICSRLLDKYEMSEDAIIGHYETDGAKKQGKTCPNFDMNWFRKKYFSKVA